MRQRQASGRAAEHSIFEMLLMNKQLYYRLIALWVLSEAMLGGIIHGLHIPVSGLLVGSCAVVCICLLAWYVPVRGAILKATILVAIFKMMLSPQSPPMAYAAVFFQGFLGEMLFHRRRHFAAACMAMAVLTLLESGLQRIAVLTIIYGNDLWTVINGFINKLTGQQNSTNYVLLIGSGYVLLHLLTGVLVGWWVARLPAQVESWRLEKRLVQAADQLPQTPIVARRRRFIRTAMLIIWILLVALYAQAYFHIGPPLLPSHISLRIILRSLIIVLGWVFVVGPLIKQLLYRWLQQRKSRWQEEVQEVLNLLPATQRLAVQSWKQAAGQQGWQRINQWGKTLVANALHPAELKKVCILTAPVQSGKTTSLVQWAEGRSDVRGILTPEVQGKRVFMDAATRQLFRMEAKEDEEETLAVGRFLFSRKNFNKAAGIIREAIPAEGWLVIDEVGPLELQGEGFAEVLREVLAARSHRILLVIRDREEMMQKVTSHFGITEATIISKLHQLDA